MPGSTTKTPDSPMLRLPHVDGVDAIHVGTTRERGVALVVALLATLVLSALGLSLLVMAGTETLIAGNYRDGVEALHAAEAALERAMADVALAPDWTALLASADGVASAAPASFGEAALSAGMVDGLTLDLVKATNQLNCPQVFPPASTPCSAAQMDHSSGDRPWGGNNPRWRLFARAWLSAWTPTIDSPLYVAVWIADDPAETDGDPARDGTDASNPGAGIVQLRSQAFGPGGTHRTLEVTIARAGVGLRVISWRLIR